MKNVLFIVYYFPPMGGSGVQRPLKFAKYLREFGWNPIILCPEPGIYHTFDETLEVELQQLDLEIHRVKNADIFQKASTSSKKKELTISDDRAKYLRRFSRLFFYPDNKRGWIKPAVQKALKIISENKIDLIFSTAPPFSNHIIGRKVKEQTGLPLVVDYRDSWTRNHFQEAMWAWQKQILRNQERAVVATSDKIICLDEHIKASFKADYPEIENRVEVVPHGFDPDDFENNGVRSSFKYQKGKLNLLYSGLFYEQNQPDILLNAVNKLIDEHRISREKIHLHFQSGLEPRVLELIDFLGLKDSVTDYGYVAHQQAVENLKYADVLWMISNFDPGLKQIKTGKLFEYFGSRKPIIGLLHASEATKLLEDYEAGFYAKPNSVTEIAQTIEQVFKLWEKNDLPSPNEKFIDQFNRKKLTQRLANIFNVISL